MSNIRLILAADLILGLSAAALQAAESPGGQEAEASLDVLVDTIRSNRKTRWQ